MSTTAHAHPNIALIKYWGKSGQAGNIPATPSLSITLAGLATSTTVSEAAADEFLLNGEPAEDAKVHQCLTRLRDQFGLPPVRVSSRNDFPTAAGLASSASGFAALMTALNTEFDLGLDAGARSVLARQASASAARSIFGGFATLEGPEWQARPLFEPLHWPLQVVVAVTDTASKSISSTTGMQRSALSPYFPGWVRSTHDDFVAACAAVAERDFEVLAELAEHSCLKMHGLMLSTRPSLLYWNPTTLACMETIRRLRTDGAEVFFTVDAGPQVKAVCLPGHRHAVHRALEQVPGVTRLIDAELGPGAWVDPP